MAFDIDGDRALNLHEYSNAINEAAQVHPWRRLFDTLDMNEDGYVSVSEWEPGMEVDMDGDGRLDFEEFIVGMDMWESQNYSGSPGNPSNDHDYI